MSELQQKIMEANKILSKLHEIKKNPSRYFLTDLNEWLESDLEQIGYALDEAYNLAEPDYPDTQLALNHELEQDIERRVSA